VAAVALLLPTSAVTARTSGVESDRMTAKGKLLLRVPDWTDEQAEIALRAVEQGGVAEPEMAPLPEGWGQTLTGEPMPNVVAAVHRSRDGH
jgi:hypothetical protein